MPEIARPEETDEMTAEEEAALDAELADPSLIATHERAVEIIDLLDHEIAQIEMQLEGARVEAPCAPLSETRLGWLRRASYAGAMKRNQRHRIMQRDKEIRGTKMPAEQPPRDRTEGVIKQMRLKAEADARKVAKAESLARTQARIAEIAMLRSLHKQFVLVANEALPRETYDLLMERAKDRSAAMKEHPL